MLLQNIRFLITQNPEREILKDVDIRVEDGRITEIGENLTTDDDVVDCSDKAVMPGLINTHTHAAMNTMRGLSDNKLLQDWLEDAIFPAEEHMDNDAVYYGTLHAIAEMVKTGTTCFNDMYAPEQPAAEAVEDAGIRAVLGRGLTDIDGDGQKKLQESKALLERYEHHDRITPVVAPHAIYTCSEELLHEARGQSEQYDTFLHTHLSETKQENDDCMAAHDMTPTAYLNDLGLLTERAVAAHAVWLTEQDMRLFQKTGAGIAHNPCSNLKLGSGIADIPRLQAHDVTLGLGTDSVASNNNLNMFEEMKFASLLQKRNDPRRMTEQAALDMATIDAAELLGLENDVGSIETGKQADLITVDLAETATSPIYGKRGILSNLVFSFHGQVTDTFVQGEPLLRNGSPNSLDMERIQAACQEAAARIQN